MWGRWQWRPSPTVSDLPAASLAESVPNEWVAMLLYISEGDNLYDSKYMAKLLVPKVFFSINVEL